ncbi:MAG: hypothetical protein AAGA11_15670 [Pseudomonadota bacterium]
MTLDSTSQPQKKWIGVLLICGLFSFGFFTHQARAEDLTSSELDAATDSPGLNWLRGERYDAFKGMIKHRMVDMRIPGNGTLDLVVMRDDKSILLPKLAYTGSVGRHLKPLGSTGDRGSFRWVYRHEAATGGTCVGATDQPAVGKNPITLDLYGQKIEFFSTRNPAIVGKARFPSNAAFVSPKNWYITCVDSVFTLHDPRGQRWVFDGKRDTFSDADYGYAIYLTSVADAFGNTLVYRYAADASVAEGISRVENNPIPTSAHDSYKDQPRVVSITASDNRAVTFTYNGDTLSGYEDNGSPRKRVRTVIHESAGAVTRWRREDGKEWYYRRQNDLVAEVRYPEGMRITYGMGQASKLDYLGPLASRDPAYSAGTYWIHTARTLHGTNVSQTWTFSRSRSGHNLVRTVVAPTGSTQFHYHTVYRANTYAQPTLNAQYAIERAQRGKLLKKVRSSHEGMSSAPPSFRTVGSGQVFTDTGLRTTEYVWQGHTGFFDSTRVTGFNNRGGYYQADVPRVAEIKTSITNGSGTGLSYSRIFSNFDSYNAPRTVVETDGGSQSRTTTLTYAYPVIDDVTALDPETIERWVVAQWRTRSVAGIGSESRVFRRSNGALLSHTVGSIRTGYSYDNSGNLSAVIDGENRLQRFFSYYRGIPRDVRDRNNARQSRVVNSDGTVREESVLGNTGAKWKYQYDALRRLSKVISPQSGRTATTIAWNVIPANRTVTRTESQGSTYRRVTTFNMLNDPIREMVEYSVPGGDKEILEHIWNYDVLGRLRSARVGALYGRDLINPTRYTAPTVTSYEYDGLDRLQSETHTTSTGATATTTYRYGVSGSDLTVARTGPTGNGTATTTTYLHAYGHPDAAWSTRIVRPHATTTIDRDAVGRVRSLGQGGVTRTYTYVPAGSAFEGLLATETHPETGTTTYRYHNDGEIRQRIQGGDTTTYTYTDANQLKKADFAGSDADRVYEYFADGALKSVAVGSNTTVSQYTYDLESLVRTENHNVDGRRFELKYDYNSLGNLTAITYPSGTRYAFAPDGLGRATAVTTGNATLASSLRYHPTGLLADSRLGALRSRQTLTKNHLPDVTTTTPWLSSSVLAKHDYGYDTARNVTSIAITGDRTRSLSMRYDKQDRLTRVAGGSFGTHEYAYDAVDNIDWVKVNGTTSNYNYDSSNKLSGISGGPVARSSFSYDPHGNATWTGKQNIGFNAANQVKRIEDKAKTYAYTYLYDGHGRRSRTTKDGKHSYSVYGIDGALRHRASSENDHQSDYHYAGGKLVARTDFSSSITGDGSVPNGGGSGDTGGGAGSGGSNGGSTGGGSSGGSSSGSSSSGSGGYTQLANGSITVEVERMALTAGSGPARWERVEDSTASGGVRYEANGTANWNVDKGAVLRVPVTITEAGEYTIYFRTRNSASGSKSLWLRVDDKRIGPFDGRLYFTNQDWKWTNNYNRSDVTLSAGEHTVELVTRTTQLSVDKLTIVPKGTPAPTGDGPADSYQAAGGSSGGSGGSTDSTGGTGYTQQADDSITVDVEHMALTDGSGDARWEKVADSAASGGYRYDVTGTDNWYEDEGAVLRVPVTVSRSGDYTLYFRVKDVDGRGDKSLWLRVNNQMIGPYNGRLYFTASGWHWSNNFNRSDVSLTAGTHTIELITRTAGLALDKISLVRRGSAAPTGFGPADSSGGTGGTSNPPSGGGSAGYVQQGDGSITVDAEHMAVTAGSGPARWERVADNTAAGGFRYEVKGAANWVASAGAVLRVPVTVTQSGDYSLYFRVKNVDGGGEKSLWLRINNQMIGPFDGRLYFNASGWHWSNNYNRSDVSLAAGTHTIELIARTAGLAVDKISLVRKGSAEPTGLGPADSSGGSGSGIDTSAGGNSFSSRVTPFSFGNAAGICAPTFQLVGYEHDLWPSSDKRLPTSVGASRTWRHPKGLPYSVRVTKVADGASARTMGATHFLHRMPEYSQHDALSADGTYAVSHGIASRALYNGKTFRNVRVVSNAGATLGDWQWHPQQDNTAYYFDKQNDRVYRYNAATDQHTVVFDFRGSPVYANGRTFTNLGTSNNAYAMGGQGSISADGSTVSVILNSGGHGVVAVLDLNRGTVKNTLFFSGMDHSSELDIASITPDGRYVLVAGQFNGLFNTTFDRGQLYAFDTRDLRLSNRKLVSGRPSHFDVGTNADGEPVLVSIGHEALNGWRGKTSASGVTLRSGVYLYNFARDEYEQVLGTELWNGRTSPAGHVSMPLDGKGVALLSLYRGGHPKGTAHAENNALIAVDVDTGFVAWLGWDNGANDGWRDRTGSTHGYYAQPHASLVQDATDASGNRRWAWAFASDNGNLGTSADYYVGEVICD